MMPFRGTIGFRATWVRYLVLSLYPIWVHILFFLREPTDSAGQSDFIGLAARLCRLFLVSIVLTLPWLQMLRTYVAKPFDGAPAIVLADGTALGRSDGKPSLIAFGYRPGSGRPSRLIGSVAFQAGPKPSVRFLSLAGVLVWLPLALWECVIYPSGLYVFLPNDEALWLSEHWPIWRGNTLLTMPWQCVEWSAFISVLLMQLIPWLSHELLVIDTAGVSVGRRRMPWSTVRDAKVTKRGLVIRTNSNTTVTLNLAKTRYHRQLADMACEIIQEMVA
jgi:hypothetical protein